MLNIFKKRCLSSSGGPGSLLLNSCCHSPSTSVLSTRSIGVVSDSSKIQLSSRNFGGTESAKALFSSSCIGMKKAKSFVTNFERTSSHVNNHTANRETYTSHNDSNENNINFHQPFRKHPKNTSYKANHSNNRITHSNNSSSNPEETPILFSFQPTNKIIRNKNSKFKKKSNLSNETRIPSPMNNDIDVSDSLSNSQESSLEPQTGNYGIPQFKKELEYNVDKLLKQVLQKVKTQKSGEPEENADTEIDSFSILKQDSDESDIFSLKELNVIDTIEEQEEENIEKPSTKQVDTIDLKFLKPQIKFKNFKDEKEVVESVKLGTSELKNVVYQPSKGHNYRKDLVDEPIAPHQKFLVEFSDCEYVQLAETHPSEKSYVGNSDVSRIPRLKNGLSRVLTYPGVHKLYDYKTNTFHFHPFLRQLHKPEEINFDNLTPFIPPSQDESLHALMNDYSCKYQSSTSAITSPLVSLYLMLSNFKPTKARNLENFKFLTSTFTPAIRKPIVFILRPKQNLQGTTFYSLDSYRFLFEPRSNQILLDLGKAMEKLFVMEPEEFEKRFVKKYCHTDAISMNEAEVYRYLRHGSFIVRSQLDCYHPKHGVFDIKTRAINRIRINMEHYEKFVNSKIKLVKGINNSYEREFYDMVRSVFVKYSMQARIGDMDGMFLAYHNTRELFGFEYLKLSEIDSYVFGNSYMAERFFTLLLDLLRDVLDRITDRFPNIPLKITFRPLKVEPYFIDIFVEPVQEDKGWSDRSPTEQEKAKWESEKFNANPFADYIKDTVYCYRLSIQTMINGAVARGYVDFNRDDKVDVLYSLEEMGDTSTDKFLMNEYVLTLKKAFFIEQ
ncbi:hypothetical protein C9374_004199 [Naegleria lovaniensis]|uniref:Uncharacterized protein n=1 Tax=Naegleria lovaniensis TaxID=51637 RepID=A0AA88GS89_NAELO|nr:uncharacterized protein C9374_004199 [Naegleria lovaniensis]KAG2383528.1 hypothetical protein C9374_004199 [Naegleria lovaniensis]